MVARLTSEDDIAKMREAGRLAASVLDMIGEHVRPGGHHRRAERHLPQDDH